MVVVPPELRPSSLLWIGKLSVMAEDLWKNCCQFDIRSNLRVLDVWRGDAERQLRGNDPNGYATVLVCLADLYRDVNKLALSLGCGRSAADHFCPYTGEIHHRHNRGVARYAAGLASQLIGSDEEALMYYSLAREDLAAERDQWSVEGAEAWLKRCEMALNWIHRLRSRLAQARARGEMPDVAKVDVPVVSRVAASSPMLADEQFDDWVAVDVRRASGVDYALRVKGDSMIDAGIRDGDLALMKQDRSIPISAGQIVAVQIDAKEHEATLKRLYREKDHYRLEPANPSYPFVIIHRREVPKESLQERYERAFPGRSLEFHVAVEPLIAGWFREVL